jgi:hypothetical protein
MTLEKTTERFVWGDEIEKKEDPPLKEIPATEKEYDEDMIKKMNSVGRWERFALLDKLNLRDNMRDKGFKLKYYKKGDEIYWSTTLKN